MSEHDDPPGMVEASEYADTLRRWRERRGLAKKALAERMGYDRTYVSHIEGGNLPPTAEFTRQADTALDTGGALWALWEARDGHPAAPPRELRTADFVAWLTDHSDAGFEQCYEAVSTRAATLDIEPPAGRYAREHGRRQVTRDQLTQALRDYYGPTADAGTFYRARVNGIDAAVSLTSSAGRGGSTSPPTRPTWAARRRASDSSRRPPSRQCA